MFPAPALISLLETDWEHPSWTFLDFFILKVDQFSNRGTVALTFALTLPLYPLPSPLLLLLLLLGM